MPELLKYARVERERRYLLAAVPSLDTAIRSVEIHDRYLHHTRLRLRLLEEEGHEPVRKLGHKVRVDGSLPGLVAHTSCYLDAEEYRTLSILPGSELRKTRVSLPWAGLVIAVDVFGGPLRGLILAEVDLGETSQLPEQLPMDVVIDVTEDERYTGGALAATPGHDFSQLLPGSGGDRPD